MRRRHTSGVNYFIAAKHEFTGAINDFYFTASTAFFVFVIVFIAISCKLRSQQFGRSSGTLSHTIITNPVIHDKSTNIDIGKPTQTSSDRDVRYGDGSKTMQRQMSLDLGMSYLDTEQFINYLPIKDPARKNWITGSVNMQGYLDWLNQHGYNLDMKVQ